MNFDQAVDHLVSSLTSLGVEHGDTLLVHSDTDILASLLPGADTLECFRLLETALTKSVGQGGTILVPTFTYSFCHGRSFDPAKRNSATGLFTNYFRRRENSYRSHHPVFSFAAMGAKAREMTENVSESGFGIGSVFDRMMKIGGKIVCFNVRFQECCTFVHHIEEMHGVDYRYFKTFEGKMILDRIEQNVRAVNYVRDLDRDVNSDFDRFAELLENQKVLTSAPISGGKILLYPCRETFELGIAAIKEHPYFLLAAPPKGVASSTVAEELRP